jgi:hypothetical protein
VLSVYFPLHLSVVCMLQQPLGAEPAGGQGFRISLRVDANRQQENKKEPVSLSFTVGAVVLCVLVPLCMTAPVCESSPCNAVVQG